MLSTVTVFDDNTLSQIARVASIEQKKRNHLLVAVAVTVCTIGNILSYRSLLFQLVVCLLGALDFSLPKLNYKRMLKLTLAREREIFQTPRTIRTDFKDDEIANTNLESNNTTTLKYDSLLKLYESADYLVFLTKGKQCLPLSKGQLTNGTADELIALIKSKAPECKHIQYK